MGYDIVAPAVENDSPRGVDQGRTIDHSLLRFLDHILTGTLAMVCCPLARIFDQA
jgi:hypothetical protein